MTSFAASILTFIGIIVDGLGLSPKELPASKIVPAFKVNT